MSKTTSSRLIAKKLKDSVFDRDLYLVSGPLDEVRTYIHNRFGVDYEDTPIIDDHGLFLDCDGRYIIYIYEYDGTPHWHSTVAHEALHATFTAMEYIGIEYCSKTEEVFTYYTDSLVKQITKILQKK